MIDLLAGAAFTVAVVWLMLGVGMLRPDLMLAPLADARWHLRRRIRKRKIAATKADVEALTELRSNRIKRGREEQEAMRLWECALDPALCDDRALVAEASALPNPPELLKLRTGTVLVKNIDTAAALYAGRPKSSAWAATPVPVPVAPATSPLDPAPSEIDPFMRDLELWHDQMRDYTRFTVEQQMMQFMDARRRADAPPPGPNAAYAERFGHYDPEPLDPREPPYVSYRPAHDPRKPGVARARRRAGTDVASVAWACRGLAGVGGDAYQRCVASTIRGG